MKKILFVLVLSCLVFSVFALDGIVVDVIGKVEKQYGDSWIALKKGDVLSPGDVVSTGFKSEAVLSIGESTVTVNALTRLTVEQLYEKNKNHVSSVYLDTGSICADIKPVENKRVGFTVKTPAVTASVRGTAGYVYAYGKVEAIRGTWGLSSPLPKEINLDRGEVDGISITIDKKTGSSSVAVNQQSNVSSNTQIEETKTDSEAGVLLEMEDVELEAMLTGVNPDSEIFVSAGEVAYSNLVVIVTPVEVRKENASNSNSGGSNLGNTILEEVSNIIVDIYIEDQE